MSADEEQDNDRASRSADPDAAMHATKTVMEQMATFTGHDADSVSGMEPAEDGWQFRVEIIELERIPQSTSVLASYEVQADHDGNVIAYHRTRRYCRNQADLLR